MKKALVIINPQSGREDGKSSSEEVRRRLEGHFDDVRTYVSKSADDPVRAAQKARGEGYDAVFAMGGDGTVSMVVRGLLKDVAEDEPVPQLGILPAGTGNGLARTMGLPSDVIATLESLDYDSSTPLDVAFANGVPFTYTLTGGSLPEGIRSVPSEDKTRFGFLAYVASELQRIGDGESHRLRITVDDATAIEDVNSFVAFSANALVNQVTSSDDTELDSGLIHLLALKDASLLALLSLVPDTLGRTIDSNDNIIFAHGTHIRIDSLDGAVRCGMDGDDGPTLPVDLTIQPGRLRTFALK